VLPRWQFAVGAVAVLALISAVSLRHVVVDSASGPVSGVLRPPSLTPLRDQIEAQGIDVAYAEYWVGYRLAFLDEHLTVIPLNSYYLDLYDQAPAEGADVALFEAGSPLIARWQALLTQLGYESEVQQADGYTLVWSNERVPKAPTLGVLDR
jgi:hypothetical protein